MKAHCSLNSNRNPLDYHLVEVQAKYKILTIPCRALAPAYVLLIPKRIKYLILVACTNLWPVNPQKNE